MMELFRSAAKAQDFIKKENKRNKYKIKYNITLNFKLLLNNYIDSLNNLFFFFTKQIYHKF
jgi:hypothetical protein